MKLIFFILIFVQVGRVRGKFGRNDKYIGCEMLFCKVIGYLINYCLFCCMFIKVVDFNGVFIFNLIKY